MAGKFKAYLIFSTIISICALVSSKLILTQQEIRALEKFRPLVEDILTHDYQRTDGYLIRWLKAKKLNVKEAVQMLRQSQKWRAENNIDSILNETFPEFSNVIYTDDGIDYEGRTVFTASVNSFDMRKIVLAGNQDRYIRFARYSIEKAISRAAETVRRSNGTVNDTRLVAVTDTDGFSLRKHACLACLSLFAKTAADVELNYPGVNGLGVYINTPRIAFPIIDLLLNLVSEETRSTIKIFGTNRTEWTNYLHTIIPPDQLSYQFGGTRTNQTFVHI